MTSQPGIARDQLRSFVERIERVEQEIKSLNDDKSDIYKEARSFGFDVKVLRQVVSKRKLDTHVREEMDAVFEAYWQALYGSRVHVHARENIEEFGISRPASLAVPGGEPGIPSPDAGGAKMDEHKHPGRPDEMSDHVVAKSGQATKSYELAGAA